MPLITWVTLESVINLESPGVHPDASQGERVQMPIVGVARGAVYFSTPPPPIFYFKFKSLKYNLAILFLGHISSVQPALCGCWRP